KSRAAQAELAERSRHAEAERFLAGGPVEAERRNRDGGHRAEVEIDFPAPRWAERGNRRVQPLRLHRMQRLAVDDCLTGEPVQAAAPADRAALAALERRVRQ